MKSNKKIRIMIVDDHFVVRMGLSGSINLEPDMVVEAEASTGDRAIALYRQHQPDVLLMDLKLPDFSGIEVTRTICGGSPDARIIMLSTHDGEEDIYQSFQAGARAYLVKTASRDELIATIRSVHAGQRCIPPAVGVRLAERMSRPRPDLTRTGRSQADRQRPEQQGDRGGSVDRRGNGEIARRPCPFEARCQRSHAGRHHGTAPRHLSPGVDVFLPARF